MSHLTRANSQLQFDFPASREEYAPWVATYGLIAPYGECQCGCGQLTSIAKKTNAKNGRRKGCPVRYVHGHNARIYAPPGFKFCCACQQTKLLAEFYPDKGKRASAYCIPCTKKSVHAFWAANRDELRERGREYRRKNREILAAKERERRADPVYREKCSIELKEWRERNKEYVAAYNQSLQVKARNRVNKLVEYGKLPRPDELICVLCEEVPAQHYHHYAGYERENWLKVIPLCTVCHGKEHRIE